MANTTMVFDPARLARDDGPLRLVLTARFRPVAGLDRFQPAGFPEIGHVIYDAPRLNGSSEKVCIVDSAASMANHLESVCLRSRWDLDLVEELSGVPYLRCVTDQGWPNQTSVGDSTVDPNNLEVVVTSFTEGHRLASTYFLEGRRINHLRLQDSPFESELANECGILPLGKNRAHPSPEAWWKVFSTIFRYDPNTLVHGVLFPRWQVKIPRVLTAHLEAFGAGRVDSSGVKFDRLGKTTSGQPIFAKDEETAREIRATFILDLALLRSFGRSKKGEKGHKGLHDKQKEFLVAFALWKIGRLVRGPFKFRTGCDLECETVVEGLDGKDNLKDELTKLDLTELTAAAEFRQNPVTDIYWPAEELYRPGKEDAESAGEGQEESKDDEAEDEE
jgi:CRISPR-associated protein Csb1